MERQDLNDPFLSDQKCDNLEVAQWQWQSNPDPYKEIDSAKWTWQSYSDDDNLMIEEAYFLSQEMVELKDYEIDLKKRLQVSKQERNKIRRVRRQGPSRFMMKLPEATVIKSEKTMNEAFGTVQHFLEFIMKRTPEAYGLYQKLKAFSLDCKKIKFEDIVHQVAACIEKGAEARAKVIKIRIGSHLAPNYILEAKKITSMLEENSLTLRDFLRTILKMYTMETFICYWLNELLRSENWLEINILTPYLVCLVYTFKLSEYVLRSQMIIDYQLGFPVKQRLYLYRGAAFAKEHLQNYNPSFVKYFSWNGVTSTSRDRNIALNFIDISLNATKNLRVLFCIEIDFGCVEDYHGIIDISLDSKYPKEQEVILAPGTVFELLAISLIENNIYQIHLKITKSFAEAHKDAPLLGIQLDQAIIYDTATVAELPSEKGLKILEHLRGNKFIRKLEIRDSGIGELIMEKIESVRGTTNLRKQNIRLIGNNLVISSFSHLDHYFSLESLTEIFKENKIRFGPENVNQNQIAHKMQVKELILNHKTIEMFLKNDQLKEFWEKLKREVRTPSIINLSFKQAQKLKEDELRGFFEYIEGCKPLEDLSLIFNASQNISIENFNTLCQAVDSSSETLSQLCLELSFSDKKMSLLCNGVKSLKCLRILSLSWNSESQISDEGLGYLKNALMLLTSLQVLSLDFYSYISDQENSLKSSFISLRTLQSFFFDFLASSHKSGQGQNSLMGASTFLTSQNHFKIYIRPLIKTSDKNSLVRVLHPIVNLQGVLLDLRFSKNINSQNLNDSESDLILLPFSDLSIDFRAYDKISHGGLDYLNHALISHSDLKHLSLNFSYSSTTFDKALDHIKSGLKSLRSLQSLSLSFGPHQEITDQDLDHLQNVLMPLTSLVQLSLDLRGCRYIYDTGLDHLKSTLMLLVSLKNLTLNFEGCSRISDLGLDPLKTALTSLTSLEHLSLYFWGCRRISDEGLHCLATSLRSLVSLQHLTLDFSSCYKISNAGLNHLKSAFTSLISLKHLYLNFGFCDKIPEKEKYHLKSALASLPLLKQIYLYTGDVCDNEFIGDYYQYKYETEGYYL